MHGFLTPLDLRAVRGHPRKWQLLTPLVYRSESGAEIVVPVGFLTDLASIPQVFQGIVPVNDAHRDAAVLHDYLFVIQDRPRAAVDALFLEAMRLSGVRVTQRGVMWAAVRLGGWMPWQHNQRARAADLTAFLHSHGLTPAP